MPLRPRVLSRLSFSLLWLGPLLCGPLAAQAAAAAASPAMSASAAAGAATQALLLTLTADQVRALRLVSQPVGGGAAGGAAVERPAQGSRHPGRVTVPDARQRVLAAPVAALVERLQVGVGDTVRAGQLLATLRSPAAQDLQREAQSAALQAELAASALARDQRLLDEGLIAASRLEATRAQARQASLLADDRRRALAQAGSSATANGGVVTLTAPISGTVIERQATVGQRVDATAPLLRIAALDVLWLELQVPVREAAAVRVGDAVRLDEPALAARVIAVARAVDAASQTVMVRAQVEPSPAAAVLRVGQGVQAVIETAAAEGPAAPAAAVVQHEGRSWVFVDAGGGRYRATPVQVLQRSGASVQLSGLERGAAVVVQGTASLKGLLAGAGR